MSEQVIQINSLNYTNYIKIESQITILHCIAKYRELKFCVIVQEYWYNLAIGTTIIRRKQIIGLYF